jgi:hypothetical protein
MTDRFFADFRLRTALVGQKIDLAAQLMPLFERVNQQLIRTLKALREVREGERQASPCTTPAMAILPTSRSP